MSKLKSLFHYIYDIMIDAGYPESLSIWSNLLVNLLLFFFVVIIIDKLGRRLVIEGFHHFSNKTKTSFDDYLSESKFPRYVSRLVPIFIFKNASSLLFQDFPYVDKLDMKIIYSYLIIIIILIIGSVVESGKRFLGEKPRFKDKPLDSFTQVIMIIFWIIGSIMIISVLIDRSIINLLAGLGALSAVIMLIFKDSILGFVASIQVSIYDMVRIGDWITLEKFNVDGSVTEVNLNTVKVQNFDNTISTIPTYSLTTESFKNWRGMSESEGRRIRRCIYIKQSSVKFVTAKDLERFLEIKMLHNYILQRQKDIDDYNIENDYDNKTLKVNGRSQTNLGLFRKYCSVYLHQHPAVNKELTIMTRHLQPTPYGIPLEMYCFSSDKIWVNYEHIMADIFEHIIASITAFDLEILELDSATDSHLLK